MELDRKTMKRLMLLIAFGIVLYMILQNTSSVLRPFLYILGLLTPFLLGGCIAFILNVPMRFFERVIFTEKMQRQHRLLYKMRRGLSLILTLVVILGILSFAFLMVLPAFSESIVGLTGEMVRFGTNLPDFLDKAVQWLPILTEEVDSIQAALRSIDWAKISLSLLDYVQKGGFVSGTVGLASSLVSIFANALIGVVFALYVLLQKEKLGRQFRRLFYAFLPEKQVDRFLRVCRLAADSFGSFLSGQCLEAFLLGLLFFISMAIFRLPYALVISVLIAVTALIPIFGAFIGCGVGALLILFIDPVKALWFVILFLVLQQIEGNFIYPRVVGSSVGLPPIWVLVAVTLGASLQGVLGMLFAIPLVSVLYTLLREQVQSRLSDSNVPAEKID